MDQGAKLKRKASPKDDANFCSVITYFYAVQIFIKGFKSELEEDDLYEVMRKLKSQRIGNKLEKKLLEDKTRHKRTSLIRLIWKCYGWTLVFYGILDAAISALTSTIVPTSLSQIVKYFSPSKEDMTLQDAYYYAGLLILGYIIDLVIYYNYLLLLQEISLVARQAFCTVIYRKCLRLSPKSLSTYTTGKIVTLITKDVACVETFIQIASDGFISIVVSTVLSVSLYMKIGNLTFIGLGILFLVYPIQIYLAKISKDLRIKSFEHTEARLQTTQEALSIIRTIKMCTWENLFCKEISKARKNEVVHIRKINYVYNCSAIVGLLNTQVGLYIFLTSYVYFGSDITAENIFFVITTFQILSSYLADTLSGFFLQIGNILSAAGRISKLLDAEELPKPKVQVLDRNCATIILSNVSFVFGNQTIINKCSCKLFTGLTVLTGPLGSGKSSLLKIIMQEYPISEGELSVSGSISYASQNPWLFPASIKRNILFGEEYKEERYKEVLEACALTYDLDILINGDETIIEDNGLNLSKGQQARINLARAIYRDRNIYLLDDCLAPLDVRVQDHIFRQCVKRFLKDKLCVLVSHNAKHINVADQVITLNNGTNETFCETNHNTTEVEESLLQNTENQVADDIKTKKKIKDKTTDHNLYTEIKKKGMVDFSVYKRYFKFGGNICFFLIIIGIIMIHQFTSKYSEKLLAKWIDFKANETEIIKENRTNTTDYSKNLENQQSTLYTFTAVLAVTLVLFLTNSFCYYIYTSRISINVHKAMIKSILNATMDFFDNTFIGNILNRFSRDLSTMDETLSSTVLSCIYILFYTLGVFGIIASIDLIFLISSLIVCGLLIFLRIFYIPTSRSLKRLDASTRGPLIGHVNASMEGLSTIRTYGVQNLVIQEYDRHQDLYTSATHLSLVTSYAFLYYLQVVSIIYNSGIIGYLLIFNTENTAGDVGLALNNAMQLIGLIKIGVIIWANLESQMTCVERVLEYVDVKIEDRNGQQLPSWPSQGAIQYKNMSLTYEKTNETVLKDVTFSTQAREKIGIIGRTGAGKSSIVNSLFKLYDIGGDILIDDVDCKGLDLSFLRSHISIMPQDPVLFKGSVRSNIDPFNTCPDEKIWNALEIVDLKSSINDLDFEITSSGKEFSAGQRQLLCLARTLLRKNKIIILDEATSNLDSETGKKVNEVIKAQFKDCTVLTIAHRINAIMDSDKIMVLEKGKLVEFGSPRELLTNKDSYFSKILQYETKESSF